MTIHCSALVLRGCWLNLSSVSEAVVLSAAELHVQKNKVETWCLKPTSQTAWDRWADADKNNKCLQI